MRRIISDGEAVSRVLNHDVSIIRKHYDKNTYFDKKREMLTAWDNWLKEVVSEAPVYLQRDRSRWAAPGATSASNLQDLPFENRLSNFRDQAIWRQ
jgi:hypothetical protein